MIWRNKVPRDTASAVVEAVRRREILVVDDVRDVADSLASLVRTVRGEDLAITVCTRTSEAFELVARRRFDVVIADYRLDGGNGLELLRRARERHPDGRRVLVTGYGDLPATPTELHAAGLSAAFQKPTDPQAFVLAIGSLLRGLPTMPAEANAPGAPRLDPPSLSPALPTPQVREPDA